MPAKLHVDGSIRGAIHSESDVTVGLSGHVEGEVFAQRLVISGTLKGNVQCEIIEIAASGTVIGDVVSRDFVVEKGAKFEGKNRQPDENRDATSAPVLKPVPTAQATLASKSESNSEAAPSRSQGGRPPT